MEPIRAASSERPDPSFASPFPSDRIHLSSPTDPRGVHVDTKDLDLTASLLREDIISMIFEAGSGHPGGSLSCADILTALYFGGVMEHSASDAHCPSRDRFILSKGHAAPALYAALARAGYLPPEELRTLRKLGSRLQGHPDMHLVPGIEVSTGSLGQGLSVACGMGLGLKMDGIPSAVFVLLGDGECQEGQVWEAAMFAAHKRLDNIVAIVDRNELQIDGRTQDVCNPESIKDKFLAFGWEAVEVDGHDISSLVDTLTDMRVTREGRPKLVIANTIKGKGVAFMEGEASWHGKAPNVDQAQEALEELRAARIERSRS